MCALQKAPLSMAYSNALTAARLEEPHAHLGAMSLHANIYHFHFYMCKVFYMCNIMVQEIRCMYSHGILTFSRH